MIQFFNKFHFFTFILAVSFLFANPPFDQDGDGQFDGATSYEFNASVTALIGDGSTGDSGSDYVVAMVDDEIRGCGIAATIPFGPNAGLIVYLTTIYSNIAEGETMSFVFYSADDESYTPINETIIFENLYVLGNIFTPFILTLSSGSGDGTCDDVNACNYTDESDCEYPEENYNCDGECIAGFDCTGVCGGTNEIDECGECGGGGIANGGWVIA